MRKTTDMTTTAIAAALFSAPMLVMQPPPIPSLTALIGGLVGFWVARHRRHAMAAAGAVAGTLAGAGLHAWQHVAEGRLDVHEGIWTHLALDAGVGLALGGAVLAAALGARHLVRLRLVGGRGERA